MFDNGKEESKTIAAPEFLSFVNDNGVLRISSSSSRKDADLSFRGLSATGNSAIPIRWTFTNKRLWLVNHNLGYKPEIRAISTERGQENCELYGAVTYPNDNSLEVYFNRNKTGYIEILT